MGTLTLNDQEQRRADVLTRLAAGAISAPRAGELLGVTARQVRRLRAAFKTGALASIPHGNKGREPAHKLSQITKEEVWRLAGPHGAYHDFNVCHLRDQLAKSHQIILGRSTLQRLLQQQRHPQQPPVSKAAPMRKRRLRSGAEGMMVQIDGSLHDWLEGRAPKMCLMGGIDDATNNVLHLRFYATETAAGYLRMFRAIGVAYGLPMSYYHDKHTILRSPKKASIADELEGLKPMSHIQKVLHDLGVESIAAHSPQAKGRVERLWQTLQDRLVKEMRLARIDTMEAANAFLPTFILEHNARFGLEAMDLNSAWVELEADSDLAYLFSMQETRVVKADHTLSFEGRTLQIRPASRSGSLCGQSISVRVTPEGETYLYDGKKRLEYRPVAQAVPASSGRSQAPLQKATLEPGTDNAKQPATENAKHRAKPATTHKPNAKQRAFIYAKA